MCDRVLKLDIGFNNPQFSDRVIVFTDPNEERSFVVPRRDLKSTNFKRLDELMDGEKTGEELCDGDTGDKSPSVKRKAEGDLNDRPLKRSFNNRFVMTFEQTTLDQESAAQNNQPQSSEAPIVYSSDMALPSSPQQTSVKLAGSESPISVPAISSLAVSSLVLAAASPYFYALFCNGMQESSQKQVEIAVPREMRDAFKAMIKSLYSSEIDGDLTEVLNILILSDQYQIKCVQANCVKRLMAIVRQLDDVNYLLEFIPPELVKDADMTEIVVKCKEILRSVFSKYPLESFWTQEVFLDLAPLCIQQLLAGSFFHARSENTVWRAVEYWCRARPDRGQYFTEFAPYIKFPLMTPDFLRDVVSMSDKLALCKAQYDEAMFYHAASSNRKKYILTNAGFQYTARGSNSGESANKNEVLSFAVPDFETLPFGKTLKIAASRSVHGYALDLTIRRIQRRDAEGVEFGFGVDPNNPLCPVTKDYFVSFKGFTIQFKTKVTQLPFGNPSSGLLLSNVKPRVFWTWQESHENMLSKLDLGADKKLKLNITLWH
jgi:hypothetical protein